MEPMTEPVPFVEPRLRFFADLRVEVGVPQEVGRTVQGLRRLVPILGGKAQGDGWQARVMPGGAEFQRIQSDTLAELDARYTLEADGADALIHVQNRAVRSSPPELMARLVRGEVVDPAQSCFRCSPQFEKASPALRWIGERMFTGTGAGFPDAVAMRFWELM